MRFTATCARWRSGGLNRLPHGAERLFFLCVCRVVCAQVSVSVLVCCSFSYALCRQLASKRIGLRATAAIDAHFGQSSQSNVDSLHQIQR
jgi:hypothetical protein